MPDPNPDKMWKIFAFCLRQVPTKSPKIARRPVQNPDKFRLSGCSALSGAIFSQNPLAEAKILGLGDSRQIWPVPIPTKLPRFWNFCPDKLGRRRNRPFAGVRIALFTTRAPQATRGHAAWQIGEVQLWREAECCAPAARSQVPGSEMSETQENENGRLSSCTLVTRTNKRRFDPLLPGGIDGCLPPNVVRTPPPRPFFRLRLSRTPRIKSNEPNQLNQTKKGKCGLPTSSKKEGFSLKPLLDLLDDVAIPLEDSMGRLLPEYLHDRAVQQEKGSEEDSAASHHNKRRIVFSVKTEQGQLLRPLTRSDVASFLDATAISSSWSVSQAIVIRKLKVGQDRRRAGWMENKNNIRLLHRQP
ncbi:hypothetical protein B0H14DRAFT_2587120 [Mycena olivaceomarginata]|nr:hypothetical protein B0H14DRAFT_2587120 [Mycena olivaceomarginata]